MWSVGCLCSCSGLSGRCHVDVGLSGTADLLVASLVYYTANVNVCNGYGCFCWVVSRHPLGERDSLFFIGWVGIGISWNEFHTTTRHPTKPDNPRHTHLPIVPKSAEI